MFLNFIESDGQFFVERPPRFIVGDVAGQSDFNKAVCPKPSFRDSAIFIVAQ